MKTKRQSKILELIRGEVIDTQELLAEKLAQSGFNVTQATISRDIRELKITKVTMPGGGFRYAVTERVGGETSKRLARVLKEGIVSADYAQNILVIKTLQGMAMAVAAAVDSMEDDDIMGTIAGDDTIFCAVKSEEKAIAFIDRLKSEVTI